MYTSQFIQCVIGGNVDAGTDVDQWQIGLKVPVAPTFLQGSIPMNQFVDDLVLDAKAFWGLISSFYAPQTSLAFVKANVIGTDGFYVNKAESFRRDFPEVTGFGPGNTLPSEVAFVVTLMTDAARGLASKGRVYLPAPASGNSLAINGRVAVPYMTACRDAVAQLVRDVGNAPGVDGGEGIADVAVMSEVREGATRRVTAVRTDDLWDTQRRRGNAFQGIKSVLVTI